jgi:hypothetical protein
VILALDKPEFFNDMFEGFVRQLSTKAEVRQANTPDEARTAFNSHRKPAVILSADESLTVSTRISLVHDALSYVLIFMRLFSGFTRPPDIKNLFSRFDLPWQSGAYQRSTFKLNRDMTHPKKGELATRYSQKALHLANVPFGDAVYLACDGSAIESNANGPGRVSNRAHTPAAFAKVGEGRVGYVGDVNNEDETTPLVLWMCGL